MNPPRTTPQSKFHIVVRGREEPFEDESGRYVATLRVVLSHRPGRRSDDAGLKCMADRAAHGAACAYNYYDTRIVEVEVLDVEGEADA